MKRTAKDLIDHIRASITGLSQLPYYGSVNAICAEISKISGLGHSTVVMIYDGRKPNPTADTMDKLLAAIKAATRKAAA